MGERTGNIAETFKETQANADNADIRVVQKDSHLLYCYRNVRIALFFFFPGNEHTHRIRERSIV